MNQKQVLEILSVFMNETSLWTVVNVRESCTRA
jgi:hypothetical protein